MKAAVIAAGRGERMARAGIDTPKPLIPLAGEPLISRTIRAAAKAGATSVACIVNDLHPAVSGYLEREAWPVPVERVVKTTASSMESLFHLRHLVSDEPFLMLTVDAVFAPRTLAEFLSAARSIPDARAVLALTCFVDDEKPLWVNIDHRYRISALGEPAAPGPYVTAGFYFFHPDIFDAVESARARNLTALRRFLGLLLEKGYPLYGVPVSKTMDVDRPEDLETAEAWLKEIDAHG